MQKIRDALKTDDVTPGNVGWQVPVILRCEALNAGDDTAGVQFFVTVGKPDAHVAPHSHDEGAGMHFVASGNVKLGQYELSTGDWIFVPRGAKYEFT